MRIRWAVAAIAAVATLGLTACGGDGENQPVAGVDGSQDCDLSGSVASMVLQPLASTADIGYAIDVPIQSTFDESSLNLIKDDSLREATKAVFAERPAIQDAIRAKNSDAVVAARDRAVRATQRIVDACGDKAPTARDAVAKVTGPKFPVPVPFNAPAPSTIATSPAAVPQTPTPRRYPPLDTARFTPGGTQLALGKPAVLPSIQDRSAVEVTVTAIDNADLGDVRSMLAQSDAKDVTSVYYIRYRSTIVAGDANGTISDPEPVSDTKSADLGTIDGDNAQCPGEKTDEATGTKTGCVIAGVKGAGSVTGARIQVASGTALRPEYRDQDSVEWSK